MNAGSILSRLLSRVDDSAFSGLGKTVKLTDDLPLYHGTSPENLASIRRNGLMIEPDARNNLTGAGSFGVSTSYNRDVAQKYGSSYGNPDVLEMRMPRDTKMLSIDSGGYGIDDTLTYNQLMDLKNSGYGGVIDTSRGQEDEVRLLIDLIKRGLM